MDSIVAEFRYKYQLQNIDQHRYKLTLFITLVINTQKKFAVVIDNINVSHWLFDAIKNRFFRSKFAELQIFFFLDPECSI